MSHVDPLAQMRARLEGQRQFALNWRGRPRCAGCYLLADRCICAEIVPIATKLRFSVLIHPGEVHRHSNTVRVLGQALPQVRVHLWHREQPEGDFRNWLDAARLSGVLLAYPAGTVQTSQEFLSNHPTGTIILMDGAWRQARRMVLHSDYLRGLPMGKLEPAEPSRFILRLQRDPGHLSTLEAAAAFLRQNGEVDEADQLLRYFDLFQARYRRNHPRQARALRPESVKKNI